MSIDRPFRCIPLILFAIQPPFICFADASFRFANYYPPQVQAPIYDESGIPLAGSNYLADVVVGPNLDSLQPVYQLVSGEPLLPRPFQEDRAGYFYGTVIMAANVAPVDLAWIQVRAWDARLGATYEAVKALELGGYGESKLFQERGFADFPGVPLLGLESFSLRAVVPEPNVAWLVALGVPWLIYRHRRKPPGKTVKPGPERRKP